MAQLAVEDQSRVEPRISLETLLYIALLVLVLVWRVTGLGLAPLDDGEAHDALASLQRLESRLPQEGGETLFPNNSLGALFNMASLLLIGDTDFAARLPTALAGTCLVFAPLLYRRYLGRSATFLIILGLAMSPVAQAASRTMSGMVWALLLLMIGGWFTLQFVDTRQKGYALAATVCGAGILFLTTSVGVLLLLGAFFGIAWGVAGSSSDDPVRQIVPSTASAWSGFEALLAAVLAVAVVATAFFTSPSGLSSISQLLEAFFKGLSERPEGTPWAYVLLVSLRYDWAFLSFGVAGAVIAWRDSTFVERFLTAWLVWGVLCGLVYGGTAEAALLLTVPAVGLTVSLVMRLLQTTAYGFWEVPNWVIPFHTIAVAALLVSLGVSLRGQSEQLWEEARIVDYAKVLELGYSSSNHVHVGTLKPEAEGSSMAFNLPYVELTECGADPDPEKVQDAQGLYCKRTETYTITVQAVALDDGVKEGLFGVRSISGEWLYGPEPLGNEQQFVFTGETAGEYRLELIKADRQVLDQYAQYMVLALPGDVASTSFFDQFSNGGYLLSLPSIHAATTIMLRAQNGWLFVWLFMIALLLPMTFFLVGAFYGARASSRGIIFGFLLYFSLYGLALGWQATNVYSTDARELWHLNQAAAQDYHTLGDVLKEYSQRDNGTINEMQVTVQGASDGALGWALRKFPNVHFVEQLTPFIATPAVLAPDTLPRPILGQEYVGQQLIFGYRWEVGWLSWLDFGSWLFGRDTRFEPVVQTPYRLWIGKELYDVENVPQ